MTQYTENVSIESILLVVTGRVVDVRVHTVHTVAHKVDRVRDSVQASVYLTKRTQCREEDDSEEFRKVVLHSLPVHE